jgi:hypothetical protein
VQNTGASNLTQFPNGFGASQTYAGDRVSQERVGASVEATLATLGSARAGASWDALVSRVATAWAGVDAFLGRRVVLSADVDHWVPTFDGDSIFNYFGAQPTTELGLRASVQATDDLTLTANAHERRLGDASDALLVPGGQLGARMRWGDGTVGFRGSGDVGGGTRRVGGDAYVRRPFAARFTAEGRVSLWSWADDARPARDATTFGYVAGLGWNIAARTRLLAEGEHWMSGLVGHRLRVMLWLTYAFAR